MKRILFALFLLFPLTAHAQFAKPPGAPTAAIANYGLTAGVWMVNSPVGAQLSIFEQHADGQWYGFYPNGTDGDQNFDATIAAAGGASAWLSTIGIPKINQILATRYPPIGPTPPKDSVGQVNFALGSYTLKSVAGVEVLSSP